LLDEVLKNLVHSTTGTYVDATFGRGGHSRALLEVLADEARVIALDRDPDAVVEGQRLADDDPRFTIRQADFSRLSSELAALGVEQVAGVLMDLGVSSPQLDDAERGFSFRLHGPLDMRMDPTAGESAAQWLNRADEAEIARVLKEYGEERFARRIARAIVAARPLHDTVALADVVAAAVPGRGQPGKHPATRTFQAVRIFVNRELEELEQGLQEAFSVLAPGGRLAVISFHSLEDRMVKVYFRTLTRPPAVPRRVPLPQSQLRQPARDVAGPLRPGIRELDANPRARSATLRVIEKNPVQTNAGVDDGAA
jgi:16S rRNA (cytosine1402-N4)-methyltransferase